MKFIIQPDSVNLEDLKVKLEQKFPGYTLSFRSKNFLIIKKSGVTGANIVLRKNKLMVAGSFPTIGASMLFTLSILLLGVLIPIIIYFAGFYPGQKRIENETAAFIKETLHL
jgi:hypothetical protein